jgi:hypothetical protein
MNDRSALVVSRESIGAGSVQHVGRIGHPSPAVRERSSSLVVHVARRAPFPGIEQPGPSSPAALLARPFLGLLPALAPVNTPGALSLRGSV